MASCLFFSLRQIATIAFLALFCILVTGLVGCIPLAGVLPYSTPTPIFVNHTLQEENGLSQLWSRNDIYVDWYPVDTMMDASMGSVCFLGDLGKHLLSKNIVCIDSLTGKTIWEEKSAVHMALAVTPDGVFVADAPTRARKYDLQTGDLLWSRSMGPFSGGALMLSVIDNQLQIVAGNNQLFVLDTNGNEIRSLSGQEYLISTPDEIFIRNSGIEALQTNTNEVLWHMSDSGLILAPLFTEDKIFLHDGGELGFSYALDRSTGRLLWHTKNDILGNPVYSSDKKQVYALRENGDLLAIDENSGQENVIAQFSSVPFLLTGTDIDAYQLAYDKEQHILLIALGDSHQLFALKEK